MCSRYVDLVFRLIVRIDRHPIRKRAHFPEHLPESLKAIKLMGFHVPMAGNRHEEVTNCLLCEKEWIKWSGTECSLLDSFLASGKST